ncbi:hypothetical protein Bbelb_394420 [Branchiostoma belcheri]|nr:hypothetical protein Bbelb_394420 [Branchiostoma belcheri]
MCSIWSQDFSFDQLLELINVWFRDVPAVIKDIMDTIDTFQRLFDNMADTTAENFFQSIIDTIMNFPEIVEGIARQAVETLEKVAAYDNLPSFIEEAKQVILRVNALFTEVKNAAKDLFDGIADSAIIILPRAVQDIWDGVMSIVEEVPKLIKSPQTAIANIAKAVYNIYKAVMTLINMKDLSDEVFLFKEGRTNPRCLRKIRTARVSPYSHLKFYGVSACSRIRCTPYGGGKQSFLFEVGTEIQGLLNDFMHVWELFQKEAPEWIEGLGQHTERVFGDMKSAKNEVVSEINKALGHLKSPIEEIRKIAGPVLEAYNATMSTIKSVKKCFKSLEEGFETARELIHKIFGPKASSDFPKKKLDPEVCGGGLYPSVGVGSKKYEHKGIDLILPPGEEVVAPFAGDITSITARSIAIATDEIKGMEAIVEGINPADSIKPGQRIEKGDAIGTAGSTGCHQNNTIHFAMRENGTSEYVDPTKYVPSPSMMKEGEKPEWIQECDDYWLTLMDKSIGSGKLTGGQQETDETPEAPEAGLSKISR